MTDEIPALLPPDQAPPVRSLHDLDRFWRSIKGPWGSSQPQLWCAVFGPDGEPALMFARPGGDVVRASDRCWARTLADAGHRVSINVWPVFLANDDGVRMAAPDDLAA